ncbi:MAG: hypothetical protein IT539_00035 [Bradyrhizobiaceae bacterium]|nr:hypothetical protein [Bradyrhizobiaceae bacterium]
MRDSGRTTSGPVGRPPERRPEARHALARPVAVRGTAGFGTPRWPALDARALLAASRIWIFLLPILAAGALSIALGPDNSWDLRYYHLYAPYAFLHGRYLYDVGPAQWQGFLNPVADLLFYGLISSKLNDAPRVVAFIMGAVHGINAVLVLAIAMHVLRPLQRLERWTLGVCALLFGVSGAGFISLLGTTSNDLIASTFVLGALLGVLKAAGREGDGQSRASLLWPGMLAGAGLGLKYTSASFIPGLALIALIVAVRRRRAVDFLAFGAGGAIAFLVFAGPHLLTLWQDFGNPVFPLFNNIFQSPYYEPESIRDARFLPRDLWQLFTYPFYWTTIQTYIVAELPFRDWRGAMAYIAIAVSAATFAAIFLFDRRSPDHPPATTRGFPLVVLFVVVSYFAWAIGFGIYRYAVVLEMLTGVVIMGAIAWLLEESRRRVAVAILASTIAMVTTVHLDWGRGDFGDKYVEVSVPPLPRDSIVLVATWDPVAYFIPFAEPKAQYVGIENNYLEWSQHNELAAKVKRLMAAPGRSKFILSVGTFDWRELDSLLQRFGLRLAEQPCQDIHSNLEVHALRLCRVASE